MSCSSYPSGEHVECLDSLFSNIRATRNDDSDSLGRVRNVVESERILWSEVLTNNERIENLPEDDEGSKKSRI